MKHDTREAEDVLDVAVAIAEADGEIEPEERKVLEEMEGGTLWLHVIPE